MGRSDRPCLCRLLVRSQNTTVPPSVNRFELRHLPARPKCPSPHRWSHPRSFFISEDEVVALEGQGSVARVDWLCYACIVCGRGRESGYWKIGAHRRSPITAEDVGQPFIARRIHRYQGRDAVCVCARYGASKGRWQILSCA